MSNKDSAELIFIKRNMKLLLGSEDTKEEIKRKKFEYFKINLKGRVGIPKNLELAKAVVNYCIDSNIIKKQEDIDTFISKASFLKDNLFGNEIENFKKTFKVEQNRENSSIISVEDLKHIREKEYLEKTEEKIGKRIEAHHRSKVESEYHEKIEIIEKERTSLEKEKDDLKRFKSQIDEWKEKEVSENIIETRKINEDRLEDNSTIWWGRLGLIQDPFPTTDGLYKIDEKYYDEIILKTKIFNEYHNTLISHPKELLNKTYIICGEFGSGKTTLFDFLRKPLILADILPIHIIMDAENDSDFMRKIFLREVFKKLNEKSKELTGSDLRGMFQDVDKGVIASIMHEINEKTKISGFVIFIDGLHKNEVHTPQVISFIQSLQNTKEYLSRDGAGIELSIFIAGSKRWKRELSLNPSLSGSRYRIDEMPEITYNEAYEMFSKRLKAFSIDKNNPTKIKRQDIEKVYKFLKSKFSRDVTFRDFVDEVIPRLEKSEFGMIEVSLRHDIQNLKIMKQELEKNEEFYSKLTSIKGIFKKRKDDFFLCLKVLLQIFNGVEESENLFIENKPIFGMLYKFGLIEKYISKGSFKWGVSKFLNSQPFRH